MYQRSTLGLCFGFILFLTMLIYGQYKFQVLLNQSQITITEPNNPNYYNNTYEFTSKDGLSLAFAMTGWDSNTQDGDIDGLQNPYG